MQDASAAVAAAQLLAFCKDPVRYRPRLTHGREVPPGGVHVFRFAQGKFPNGLLRELPAQERERLRQAAVFFIRQICFWDGASHYQVLCVPAEARREAIKEHYHSLIALIHPDRQDADSEHWPPEAAHRVNLAYAVLSDDAQRAEYDAGLHKSVTDRQVLGEIEPEVPQMASVRVPVRGKFAAARMRFRKPLLFVAAAVASLFYLHVWVASQVSEDFGVLDSATPLELSMRLMRNIIGATGVPHYLGRSDSLAALHAVARETGRPEESLAALAQPRKASTEIMLDPLPEPARRIDAAGIATALPRRTEAALIGAQGERRVPAVEVAATPRSEQPQEDGERPGSDSKHASAKPSVQQSALNAMAMEILVSRLATYYESGDLTRFLALFDPDSLGFWEARGVRGDFEGFFAATSTRQLHFRNILWEFAPGKARATGQAALRVEYKEGAERIERIVPVELEVVDRGGSARIARISLFPREKGGR